MSHRTRSLVVILLLIPAPLVACLWDSDTLEEERRQFPSVLELITGKFLRHSPAFYEWRIKDRQKRIEEEPDNVALYDDLAVAYEKTGQIDLAIETILKKEEIAPGLYETYANLGTFYIHAGRLEEGLKEIEKAIEINPDAHFGREVYQKLLVEYVLLKKADGKLELPMSTDPDLVDPEYKYRIRFGDFVMKSLHSEKNWPEDEFLKAEVGKATKGVLGMMRFGNFDSPILLEALADLMTLVGGQEEAKYLATRALLQASYVSDDPEQKDAFRQSAEDALAMQTRSEYSQDEVSLKEVETQFRAELNEAAEWYEAVEAAEKSWIAAGLNPEAEFAKRYSNEPSQTIRETLMDKVERNVPAVPTEVVWAIAALVGLFVASRVRATRRRNHAAVQEPTETAS